MNAHWLLAKMEGHASTEKEEQEDSTARVPLDMQAMTAALVRTSEKLLKWLTCTSLMFPKE